MKQRAGGPWLMLAGAFACFVFLRLLGLQTLANIAGVVQIVPVAQIALTWWQRRSTPGAVTDADVVRGEEMLVGLVKQQWRTEASLRSLDDPDPIPVRWRLTRDERLIDNPANLTPSSLQLTASSDQIDKLLVEFQRMRRRRLVILGGPGTGKTTLAVQLLLGLLASRQPDDPVPVLLSVAGWDTATYPQLQEWLAARLELDYPALRAPTLGSGMAEALAKRGRILPVLDGLDELPAPAQAAVITALNRSLNDTDQLILTSRTIEYGQAVAETDVLTSAIVIEPDPLDPTAAADYLRRCLPRNPGSKWEEILTGLRDGTDSLRALTEIAQTPLDLWLLRAVYIAPHRDPGPLLEPPLDDTGRLRSHLFDELIPALIASRPPSADPKELFRPRHRHDPVQVRHWLGYLADHLRRLPTADGQVGTRDFAWWQLARHALPPLVLACVSGLVGFVAVLAATITNGNALGFPFSVVVGIAYGFGASAWMEESPGFAHFQLAGRLSDLARRAVGLMLLSGLTIGLASGLVGVLMGSSVVHHFGPMRGFVAWLLGGVVVGGVGGALFGAIYWAETPTSERPASTPLTSWRADRSLNLFRIVASMLVGGLLGWLVLDIEVGLGFRFSGGLVGAVAEGLVGGLLSALLIGTHHAWPSYLVASYYLAWKRVLPRELMPFLDDAHRLGLLRSAGPIYQFRHAQLQDRLADAYRASQRESSSNRLARDR